MKEHDTYTTDSAHNFVVGLNEYAKNGWEVDFKSTFFRPEISNELLHVAHLSREVPTVAKEEAVQETPPSAGERPSDDLLWQAYEKGIELGGLYRDQMNHLFTKWISRLPADPLEADRKLLRTLDADNKVIFCAKTTEQADIFYEAFKRVIGYGN